MGMVERFEVRSRYTSDLVATTSSFRINFPFWENYSTTLINAWSRSSQSQVFDCAAVSFMAELRRGVQGSCFPQSLCSDRMCEKTKVDKGFGLKQTPSSSCNSRLILRRAWDGDQNFLRKFQHSLCGHGTGASSCYGTDRRTYRLNFWQEILSPTFSSDRMVFITRLI